MKKMYASVLSVLLLLPAMASASVFPVDTASAATIVDVKADLVAWGVVLISVALVIYAFKRIRGLVTR